MSRYTPSQGTPPLITSKIRYLTSVIPTAGRGRNSDLA